MRSLSSASLQDVTVGPALSPQLPRLRLAAVSAASVVEPLRVRWRRDKPLRCNGHALSIKNWGSRNISSLCCVFSPLCRVRRPEAQRCVYLCTAGLDLFLHLVVYLCPTGLDLFLHLIRHWWYLTRDYFDSRSYQHFFQLLTTISISHMFMCLRYTSSRL